MATPRPKTYEEWEIFVVKAINVVLSDKGPPTIATPPTKTQRKTIIEPKDEHEYVKKIFIASMNKIDMRKLRTAKEKRELKTALREAVQTQIQDILGKQFTFPVPPVKPATASVTSKTTRHTTAQHTARTPHILRRKKVKRRTHQAVAQPASASIITKEPAALPPVLPSPTASTASSASSAASGSSASSASSAAQPLPARAASLKPHATQPQPASKQQTTLYSIDNIEEYMRKLKELQTEMATRSKPNIPDRNTAFSFTSDGVSFTNDTISFTNDDILKIQKKVAIAAQQTLKIFTEIITTGTRSDFLEFISYLAGEEVLFEFGGGNISSGNYLRELYEVFIEIIKQENNEVQNAILDSLNANMLLQFEPVTKDEKALRRRLHTLQRITDTARHHINPGFDGPHLKFSTNTRPSPSKIIAQHARQQADESKRSPPPGHYDDGNMSLW